MNSDQGHSKERKDRKNENVRWVYRTIGGIVGAVIGYQIPLYIIALSPMGSLVLLEFFPWLLIGSIISFVALGVKVASLLDPGVDQSPHRKKESLKQIYKIIGGILGAIIGVQISLYIIGFFLVENTGQSQLTSWFFLGCIVLFSFFGIKAAPLLERIIPSSRFFQMFKIPIPSKSDQSMHRQNGRTLKALHVLMTIIASIVLFPLFFSILSVPFNVFALIPLLFIVLLIVIWKLSGMEYFSFSGGEKQHLTLSDHWRTIHYARKWIIFIVVAIVTIFGIGVVFTASTGAMGSFGWLFIYGDNESRYEAAKWFILASMIILLLLGMTSIIRGGLFLAMKITGSPIQWEKYGLSIFITLLNILFLIILILR